MLKIAGMVESTSGTDALELEAKAGEGLMVRDIDNILAAAGAEDITISIDRKQIMQFVAPASWYLLGNMFPTGFFSIVSTLRELGLLHSIPIAEGEKMTITAPGANDFLNVRYDVFDADNVQKGMPNGSKGDTYDLFQVVSNSAVGGAAGDIALDQSDLDTVFPAFPGGAVVPARHHMTLKALFGSPVCTGSATGEYTTRLKMLRDREDMLDADLLGIDFLGDLADAGAATIYTPVGGRISAGVAFVPPRILVFDEPTTFEPGSELNVFATIGHTGAGDNFIAGEIKLGMLFEVKVG